MNKQIRCPVCNENDLLFPWETDRMLCRFCQADARGISVTKLLSCSGELRDIIATP